MQLRRSPLVVTVIVLTALVFGRQVSVAQTDDGIETARLNGPVDAVEAARLKGVAFLKTQQNPDGSWFYPSHAVGITSLCGLALVENGIPVSDPVVEKAHAFVRRSLDDLKNTYDLALGILFLSRVGDRDNRTPIRDMAARLIAGQNVDGGWGYTCPLVNSIVLTNRQDLPDPPDGPGDNSCTQFGTLGLWVASRWGVNIDETMERVGQRFADTQMEDGGWTYRHDQDGAASRNSMTFAGLFCLTVSKATAIRQQQEQERTDSIRPGAGEPQGALQDDPVFASGLTRAGQFAGGISRNAARYFLWSVERLGVLLGLEDFGEVNWFTKGAEALVATQQENGAWQNPSEDRGNLSDTSFAILFLRKANLGSDISRLLAGEPDLKFQNITREDEPRYFKLSEAIEQAEAGDVIRVDGNGPYEMPQYNIDKDLVIEAGYGYTPAFRYEVGYDERGRRLRPEDNPDARFMLRVKDATLTLEGIELQMDPPGVRRSVSWDAIVLNGGNLRMLNCTVSESNESGMAAINMSQPGSVLARNCLFVGGRCCLELLRNGDQEVRMENSVVYSQHGFHVFNSPAADVKTPSPLKLELDHCAIQCSDVFWFPMLSSPVEISSTGCAYKAEWLGSKMLTAANDHAHIAWTGKDNIYDVRRWIGANGRPVADVRDERTWSRYWGGADESGSARTIVFSGRRNFGAFSHSVGGEDFEFAPNSAVNAYRRQTGIDPLIVGPGSGFSRYRESFQYRTWEDTLQGEVAAE
jgi:hypothetical protein